MCFPTDIRALVPYNPDNQHTASRKDQTSRPADQTVVDLGKQADVVKVSCNIVQGACEIAHGTVYDCMAMQVAQNPG